MERILVAEADPRLAELIHIALERVGFGVDVLPDADARHGLAIVSELRDVFRLRARVPGIRVLLLAAEEVGDLPGVTTLPKPFDLDELRWEVARVLDPPRATGGRSGGDSGPPVTPPPSAPSPQGGGR